MNNENYTRHLKRAGYSKSTIAYQLSVLDRFSQWTEKKNIELIETTYTEILAYVQHCQQRGAGKTGTSRYLVAIKKYYNYLVSTGTIKGNPAESIKLQGLNRKKLYEVFSPSELSIFYQKYAKQSKADQWKHSRNVAIAGLFIFQGLTTTELIKLAPRDVNMREGLITVPGTRRSNERILKMEVTQIMDLLNYVNTGREKLNSNTLKPSENLFFSLTGTSTLHNVLHEIVKELKKLEPRLESLLHIRASVITKWLKKYNLRKAQYMAGHRYISSTESYLVNDLEGLQEEINQFHPLG
jgi:integrase/recombinase XerD